MSVRLSAPAPSERPRQLNVSLLASRAKHVLRELGHARSELSLALVDNDKIKALNREWRNRSRATDVLSFSLLEGDHARHRASLLGDVVIGLEVARKQAARRHRSLDEEVSRLMIHGVLHLLGHDHVKSEEARVMRSEERRLWGAVRESAVR